MKRFKSFVLMSSVLLFAWGVNAGSGPIFYEESGTTDYAVTFKSMAQGFAVLAWSSPITITAYSGGTAVDTVVVEAGNSQFFYCPANHLHIDRTLATAVTINVTYNNQINPSLGFNSVPNLVDADWITITNGYHTAAAGTYSFLPLQPLGEHNLVAFQLSWATADTIWVQVIASNSMMDSSTVFNFGTADAPVYSKRVLLASLVTDTAPSGFSASLTGNYEVVCPFSFLVQDANGYPGIPKFVGIRIRSNGEAITAMKIVMGLATLNTCGGE
jgi:hypothetical protein